MSVHDTPAGLACYLRVSSAEQKQQGTIETQRAAVDRYLAVYDLAPYGWYADDGVSGTVPFAQRPEGARLLADARAGHVGGVLIWRLDRFGRNAREILNAVHELKTLRVRLVSITENFDTSTPAGQLQLNMLAAVAQFERDSIIQRGDEGKARRLLSTTWMGGPAPLGYRAEGKKSGARLVVDDTPDEATGYTEPDVVRLAWHLLCDRDWTSDQIAEHLGTLGVPTPAQRAGREVFTRNGAAVPLSGDWAPATVRRMFANPVYKGERHFHTKDGRVVVRPVPALVTPERWERAQMVIANHRRYTHRDTAHEYLLRGLLTCGLCGDPYTTGWSNLGGGKGPLWRYYACSTKRYRAQYYRRPGRSAREYPRD